MPASPGRGPARPATQRQLWRIPPARWRRPDPISLAQSPCDVVVPAVYMGGRGGNEYHAIIVAGQARHYLGRGGMSCRGSARDCSGQPGRSEDCPARQNRCALGKSERPRHRCARQNCRFTLAGGVGKFAVERECSDPRACWGWKSLGGGGPKDSTQLDWCGGWGAKSMLL